MFASLPFFSLLVIFVFSAVIVWFAGIQLSRTTDILDTRFKLGSALGGLILLAIATNLPEIAIVGAASLNNNIDLALGNILGGIAIQTIVLVLLDYAGLKNKAALTFQANSLQLVLEGLLVIAVLVLAIMGSQLPSVFILNKIPPIDITIVIFWLLGLWLINKSRRNLPWHKEKSNTRMAHKDSKINKLRRKSTIYIVLIFSVAAIATLIAGILLEETSTVIAKHIGWSGVVFGATILAAITALPELSTGLAAIRLGNVELAISDIFGGNAFLPVLFLPASLIAGKAILTEAQHADIYLASVGILLTTIYLYGLIVRPSRQIFNCGMDSILVIAVYLISLLGLKIIT